MKRVNLVIPMKPPTESKQRLKDTLANHQRYQLALDLFQQTLAFFGTHFSDLPILVVTRCEFVAKLAKQQGASVLLEAKSQGLNAALEQATLWSIDNGFESQLIVPADIAQLDVQEVKQLLGCDLGNAGVAIAVAKDQGTNALLSSPPNAIPFHFGYQSAKAHQSIALRAAINCHLFHFPYLGKDIDIAPDLAYLQVPLLPKNRLKTSEPNALGDRYASHARR